MTIPETRYTLKQLSVPAKLVVSLFLLSVGLGYFSALVQLHLQHSSRNGEPLPSAEDVIEIFAGKKKYDPNAPAPVSKLERLVTGPVEGLPWNGSGSMAAAFYHKDGDNYKSETKDDPAAKIKLDKERAGEQAAVKAWMTSPEEKRKAAYETDRFIIALDSITPAYRDGEHIKIKSILQDRCARCHAKDADVPAYPLQDYTHYLKYMAVTANTLDSRGWVRSERQTSIEKLTQSTHAHLLSFSMLFGLTGFLFAFTRYPTIIRMVFAPLVLLAQIADVSCWWLARLPESGPYFAQTIILTGGLVGMGLTIHILGCLFDMWNHRGRIVLVLLFAGASAGFCALYMKAIEPALTAQKAAKP